MKKRRMIKSRKLWIVFTFLTFFVMSVSLTVMILFFIAAYKHGFINTKLGVSAFVPFSLTSVAVATVLSMLVSRILLSPVNAIADATKKITKGDFSSRIPENSLIEEISWLGKNFNMMMTELEKLEGFRSDFGANVSHEFKTPLGQIKGYAELLRDEDLTAEERENYTSQIIDGVDRLNALSEKLLSLSRIENQQMVLNKTEFSLDEQIRQAFLVYETRWVTKDIEPSFEMEELTFYGDSNLIYQIWTNLFDNAIKFTPDGGKINITLTSTDNLVEIKVFNSGDGITEKDISHIFEKFYQVDKSRKNRGSGLGLPLVKRIIELCGGEISVSSELGVGTEFKVLLPIEKKV